MARRPNPNSQRRTVGGRSTQRVIRVLREGFTEGEYLSIFDQSLRGSVRIVLDDAPISSPFELVQRAAELQKASQKAHRKNGASHFDEIWCVFDCDEHPKIAEAMVMAIDNGVKVAFSNPCFELWLVLHQESQSAWIHRHQVQRRAAVLGLVEGKHITSDGRTCCAAGLEAAVGRAQALDQLHRGNGSPEGENPSSSMWQLIERLR